jgi:hypothetical protein
MVVLGCFAYCMAPVVGGNFGVIFQTTKSKHYGRPTRKQTEHVLLLEVGDNTNLAAV